MTRPARYARIAATYALELAAIWLDVAHTAARGVHRAAHTASLTAYRIAHRIDPDT